MKSRFDWHSERISPPDGKRRYHLGRRCCRRFAAMVRLGIENHGLTPMATRCRDSVAKIHVASIVAVHLLWPFTYGNIRHAPVANARGSVRRPRSGQSM